MARYKRLIPLLLTLIFAAILVQSGHRLRNKVLRELGLTPSCVKRVVATCHISPVQIKTDRESFVKMVEKISDTEQCLAQIKTDLQSLNRLEQKSKSLKNDLIEVKTNLKSLNRLEEKISTQEESLRKFQKQLENNNAQISLLVNYLLPQDCADVQRFGDRESGVRTVYPYTCCKNKGVTVFCDQTTDGGGWTVFQRRDALPQRENFFRGWHDYQTGFGNVTGEFWLGLDNIHALVSDTPNELYVALEDFEGDKRWAKYDTFSIEDADGKFQLHVEGYSGSAGDALKHHNGIMFSTKDQNNDIAKEGNCAERLRGAWWFYNCLHSHLNGFQLEGKHESNEEGINWHHFKGDYYSLKKSEMKIRPKV